MNFKEYRQAFQREWNFFACFSPLAGQLLPSVLSGYPDSRPLQLANPQGVPARETGWATNLFFFFVFFCFCSISSLSSVAHLVFITGLFQCVRQESANEVESMIVGEVILVRVVVFVNSCQNSVLQQI